VHIVCTVSSLTITSKAADAYYVLNQGTLTTNALLITQTDACVFPFTYTHEYTKNSSVVTKPAWISFDNPTTKFGATITLPADVGIYTIKTTSMIP